MPAQKRQNPLRIIDAGTFQKQLGSLANTIAYKIEREAPKLIKPNFTAADICVMLRQSLSIYELFCFINADERRKHGVDWKVAYSAAVLPLVRCMIDCLYNITAILTKPGEKGYQFRESGYKKALKALDTDEQRYGGDPEWDSYIRRMRDTINNSMRADSITAADVNAAKTWPTLGRYLTPMKGAPLTTHQQFLKRLTFGFWEEYSGMAHATFQGLLPTAMYYVPDLVPHELRERFETDIVERMIALNVFRAAGILLCTLTEVQAHFRFEGAHINQRIHQVWKALLRVPEIKELYTGRYKKLMKERGINPE